MKMRETSRGKDKKPYVNNNRAKIPLVVGKVQRYYKYDD